MQPGRGHEDSDDEYDEEIGYSFNLGISCSDRAESSYRFICLVCDFPKEKLTIDDCRFDSLPCY